MTYHLKIPYESFRELSIVRTSVTKLLVRSVFNRAKLIFIESSILFLKSGEPTTVRQAQYEHLSRWRRRALQVED